MRHFIIACRCFVALATIGFGAAAADAGQPANPRWAHDVVVGKVKQVSAEPATNGNPARVTVEITQTLRGKLTGTIVAIWSGPDHGVDWGEPSKNPIVIKWAAAKAEKPTVGDVFILYGNPYTQKDREGKESQVFYTSPGGRLPLTEKNLADVVQAIKEDEIRRKEAMERHAAEVAKQLARVKAWRAGMTDKKLAAAVSEADVVALGTISGQGSGNVQVFAVSEVFKGRTRSKAVNGKVHYLQVPVSKEAAELVDRQSTYLLLLSEKNGLVARMSVPEYQAVGDGVVLADADAIRLVREATKDLAGKGPPAVAMYPDDAALAGALLAAADGKVTVIRSPGYRDFVAMAKVKEYGTVADFYLRVTRSEKSIKLQLARSSELGTLLMDTTLAAPDDAAIADQAAKIVAMILEGK